MQLKSLLLYYYVSLDATVRVVSAMILLLDQLFCELVSLQEKLHFLRGVQIQDRDCSETYPLLPGGLQETHTDTG